MTSTASALIENFSIPLFFLCIALGMFGQLLRSVIGLYKIYNDKNKILKEDFKWQRFAVSLAIGGMVGMMLSLVYTIPMSNMDIFGCIAGAYGGTDFLEGFLKKRASEIQ